MSRRLFIPGTGGCVLQDLAGNPIASILHLALDRQRDFLCEHAADPDVLPPLRTSGLRDAAGNPVEIQAVGPVRAAYQPFFEQVQGLNREKVYEFFDYDFRLDLRFNGERLWQKLREGADDQPWDIVCHSQGGLLVVWASLLAGPAQFPRRVRRVVCLSTPFQGTVNAADALLHGASLATGLDAHAATVRTWPSIYMMLPRWRLHVPGATGVELFKPSTWQSAGCLAPGDDVRAGISANLLLRAQAWKAALDNQSFEALRSIERLVIVQGDNLGTWARAPDFPRLPSRAHQDGENVVRGDGLVPADLTLRLLPQALSQRLESIVTPVQSHNFMCADPSKAELCERIFAE
jgi:hypothetical protein